MIALGMTALHLRIADFKFNHNFVICNRLPDMEIIFLTYTRNCEQKATIGTVKSSLKIPPRHNGVIPIKITGPVIEGHMAYFITTDNSTQGRDPNINIINGIHSI